jgi:phospholipase C|eukprot:COSAG02_NODE_3758_length_6273_cov_8.454810_4_plen_70_part_00
MYFYLILQADAAAGTLPNFAMIQPNGSRCDHPCADIAHGERLDKDIYEALRAGPAWNKTLFLIVWDDVS